MFKKIVPFAVSAVIAATAAAGVLSPGVNAADEITAYTDYVNEGHISVFDLIKIKRSLAADDGRYTFADYDYVSRFLVKLIKEGREFAKKVFVSFDKDGASTEYYTNPSVLDPKLIAVGTSVVIPQHSLEKSGASQAGWLYEGVNYKQGERLVVPDHNITLTPCWNYYHMITYYAGDYDDIVGQKTAMVKSSEGIGMDLADSSRFSRKGYTLSGWECTLNGEIYGTSARYIVPDTDVTFNAVWTPSKVDINISANNGNSLDKIT